MDRRSKKIATGYKARVAMIYSWSSRASHNEACYLGGRLQLGTFPDKEDQRGKGCQEEGSPPPIFNRACGGVMMPNVTEDGKFFRRKGRKRASTKRVASNTPIDKSDGIQCGRRLGHVLNECHNDRADVAVVDLQRGIRTYSGFDLSLRAADILVLGGVMGVSVARGEKGELYQTLGPSFGCIVMERLKRTDSTRGEKFFNLLESSEIPVLFRRQLLPYAYGGISHDVYQGLAMLTVMDMKNFVTNYYCRRAWCVLLIECSEILACAAQGSGWMALNPCGPISLPMMMVLLRLPLPIFNIVASITGLDPPSQIFLSLHDNAKATKQRIIASIDDLVRLARRNGYNPKGLVALRRALIASSRLAPAELLSLVSMTSGRDEMAQVRGDGGKNRTKQFHSIRTNFTMPIVCAIPVVIGMLYALRVKGWGAFPILLVIVFIWVARFTKGSTGY